MAANIAPPPIAVNYRSEREKVANFLEKFTAKTTREDLDLDLDDEPSLRSQMRFKYKDELDAIAERKVDSLVIELDDIAAFYPQDEDFLQNIENNTMRYESLFSDIVDSMLPANNAVPTPESSPLEVIIYQRKQRDAQRELDGTSPFPTMLTRRYQVYFKPRSNQKALSIRDIKGDSLGRLVTVRGMVTRASNVKPKAIVIGLSCDKCGYETFQMVEKEYTPIVECPTPECKRKGAKGRLRMQIRASKFHKFQEVKIQELTDQVPLGHIPRTMTVNLTEALTRLVSPGDTVCISGIFLPVPYAPFRGTAGSHLTDTYLLAQNIVQMKKQYSQMELTAEISDQIRDLTEKDDLYGILARSIAPEIYGHNDIKKALLLLLVGGSAKETGDGMKIRGDLNICLMGDPGVAKSQLLKYISKIAPRGVYTTGRGSSGVGLTASVMRDPVTDEMVLEGGALVLADNGIACIDEFDKMDENDRTAIHEVMEQQTISISKAGITTTLNARTSILAAANPQFGRYNTKLKASDNINLPAALLSRFDLLFLILDHPNMEDDIRLAKHVTHVHMHNTHPVANPNEITIDANVMRNYIALAKMYKPKISKATGDKLVNIYASIRRSNEFTDVQYSCARTLLSLIRLASALARLRFSDEVELGDVEEAYRLLEASKVSVSKKEEPHKSDPVSQIYYIIRDMAREGYHEGGSAVEIDLAQVKNRITSRGLSDEDLERCIETYENSNLWMRTRGGTALAFLNLDDN